MNSFGYRGKQAVHHCCELCRWDFLRKRGETTNIRKQYRELLFLALHVLRFWVRDNILHQFGRNVATKLFRHLAFSATFSPEVHGEVPTRHQYEQEYSRCKR